MNALPIEIQKTMFWVALFIVFIAICGWHIHENKSIKYRVNHLMDEHATRWVTHFAWMRSIQLFSVIACAALLLISYEMQLTALERTVTTLAAAITQKENAQKTTASAETAITPPVVVRALSPERVIQNIPTKIQAPSPMEELYNPENSKNDAASSMDEIKKRYEDIFVTYMFLKKCNKTGANDYGIISNALIQEIASVNAPKQLQFDILSAAEGSYKEMYLGSACNIDSMNTLYTQYTDYLTSLSNRFPAP